MYNYLITDKKRDPVKGSPRIKSYQLLDRRTVVQVLVKEALKSLCLTNSHGKAGLANAVLAVFRWKGRDSYDVRTSLLGCGVTVDTEAEALGGL